MNDFKEFKETKIPHGTQVVFELLNVKDDPINVGRKVIPLTMIPPRDVIFLNGEMHEIGAVINTNPDKTYNLEHDIIFKPDTGGKLVFTSGNVSDEIKYKFFKWSNFNASNKNRDTSKPAIFREVNPEKDAAERLEKAEAIIKAKSLIQNLNDEEVKSLARTLGVSGKEELYTYADNNAAGILSLIDTIVEVDLIKIVNKAVQRKKIQTNYVDRKVSFNKQVIFEYEGVDWDREAFVAHLESTNKEILGEIVKSVL